MAVTGTLNVRLDESLKRQGCYVLERNGMSTSEIVRNLFELLVRTQEVPESLRSDEEKGTEALRKHKAILGFVEDVRSLVFRDEVDISLRVS